MSEEMTCNEFTVCSMSFNKRELELLDDALRVVLCTSMERLSKRVLNNKAEYIFDDIRDELLGTSQLLMRVARMRETAFNAEEGSMAQNEY